ncbi:MAG: LssY C-terminal domain-containing protein [Candidatus Parcubacteria bacterium]|nr:LssY C-terminal domain-containing protein [Candidatus Parcubacteria bacterium]
MNFIDILIQILTKLQNFSYLLVFLISFLESLAFVGIFIPGTIFNIFMGFLAGKGMFDIGDLIWFAVLGAILGDGLSFYLGKKANKIFRPENRIFKSNYLVKGEKFFKKHGNKSIFVGRFIGPIRPIIPFVAGIFKMETKRFIFWNVLSAFAWAAFYLFLGYFFGQAWQIIAAYSSRASIFLIALAIFLVLYYLLKELILKEGKRFLLFLKSILISIIQAITKNTEIINLIKNHPLIFGFLQHRLDKKNFSGLPLTLFTLAFLYIIFLFLDIIRAVIKSAPITAADIRLENLLYVFRQARLARVFTWITILGEWEFCLSLIFLISLLFWLWHKKNYILPFWVTLAGTEIFVFLGKLALNRPRPEDVALYLEKSASFPSGHAALAMALYGFLIYFAWRHLKSWPNKLNALFAGILIIIVIGFSRLYLGLHYLSDILGGYLLALLWLIIGINLIEWPSFKKEKTPGREATNKLKLITISLIILEVLFYVGFAYHFKPEVIILEEEHEIKIIKSEPIKIFSDYKLAQYSETIDGTKQEPISFLIVAQNDNELINTFQKAGWILAEPANLNTLTEIAKSAILNQSYDSAPMTPSFWNANIHDFGFEKPTANNTVRQRHHTRFWRTDYKTSEGKNIYVGTASLDIGIKWLVIHTIKPDIDTEREFLFTDLQKSDLINNYSKEQFVEPLLGKNFTGDQFFTDGQIYIIILK